MEIGTTFYIGRYGESNDHFVAHPAATENQRKHSKSGKLLASTNAIVEKTITFS